MPRCLDAYPFVPPGACQPRLPISIRVAVPGERDLKFIDALQKQHSNMVGFASTEELLTHINEQTALVAEEEGGRPIGYCLYRDRYMKREDCGYVSQLNVAPNKHRGLVGAALIQAMFERVPYGVRLFCCWCAQDLEANHFWEALGFVPLAFRSGSRGKAHGGTRKETRMHIFWQRRVRQGVDGQPDEYPYWFPSQTTGGRMGEARIVLPIPPGTHWSDAKPAVLPGAVLPGAGMENHGTAALPEGSEKAKRVRKPKPKAPPIKSSLSVSNGLRFGPPTPAQPTVEKPKPQKRPKQKNDPKHVAAARELRDRYLEQINTERMLPPGAQGKYDVSRALACGTAPTTTELQQTPPHARLLNAA